MTTELTKAAQQALEACPFCGCDMRIESNRDWHKLHGNHAEGCVFSEDAPVMTVPATDCQLEVLVHDWNTRALTQRPAAQTEAPADPRIRIDLKQATELLEMFNGLPAEIVLQTGDGHSGRGLYAWWDADPSAGAMYLGETDEEAAPQPPTAPQQATPSEHEQDDAIRDVVRVADTVEEAARFGVNAGIRLARAPQQSTPLPFSVVADPSIAPGEAVVKLGGGEVGRIVSIDAQQATPEPSINWFGTHFTYKNQPCDNVTCWRLGEAARSAKPGGDLIDHGLSLLQELEKHGYGVYALAAAPEPVLPFLVRDVSALLGASVPDVCKALAHLGHGQRSTNMAIAPYEALEVAAHIRPATPEPVGEPVARVELMQTGGNAGLATRIVEIDDPLRERLRPGDVLYHRPAPGVPDGWRDAKNDPPPVGVDVLVAVEFDGPGDWRIKVGGRNPQERTGWCVFGASWAPQVWMPLDAHRAALAAAQAKGEQA